MRIKALMLATAGLTVAGGSAYIAQTLINTSAAESSPAPAVRLVPVVIAASDIGFGQEIERTMLSTIKWPENALPPGVYTEFTDLLPQGEDEGRRARRAIGKGELVLAGKVSNFGEKVTIVQTLGPNRRAMAIKVDAETAVGGFVTPGDYVDVLLTQGREESLRAVTILQNIRVIGVDQDSDEQSDMPEVARTVTDTAHAGSQRRRTARFHPPVGSADRTLSRACHRTGQDHQGPPRQRDVQRRNPLTDPNNETRRPVPHPRRNRHTSARLGGDLCCLLRHRGPVF